MSNPAQQWAQVWARLDAFVEDRPAGRAKGTLADALAAICAEELIGEDHE
jgi:hypothetical protein